MNLENGHALVTGGSSGIGLAIARAFRQRGAKVAINGRREGVLMDAAGEIGAVAIPGDVSVEEDAVRIVRTAIEELGDLDILVNNAGFGRFSKLVDLTVEEMRSTWETNVLGATLVAREAARHFVGRGGGNIINIASTAGLRGFAGGSSYVSTKFALGGLTECWRAELRKHDIRVMQINPSEVQTSFAAAGGREQRLSDRKLRANEIAHAAITMLEMDDRGFVTDLTVWATNPD